MKPSVYGTVRKMLKTEHKNFGTYSTQKEVLQKVEGNVETVKRAYRQAVTEIKSEDEKKKEVAESFACLEKCIIEDMETEFRLKALVFSSIAFTAGFAFGALLLIF